jgi:Acyl-CoA dehydrogenase, N-terminal domain
MDPVAVAERLADELLFPAALTTDAAEAVPQELLDALAEAGLYGVAGPEWAGGLDLPLDAFCAVAEALAGGCLTTAFVWMQHHGAVRAVASSADTDVRAAWAEPLTSGRVRAGLALGGAIPGPALLRARAEDGGWILSGESPWLSGWGRVDVVHTAARTDDGRLVWALVDAREDETLRVTPLSMVALQATATVSAHFREHPVPPERVTAVVPFAEAPAPPEVLRVHATLALGVACRCCRLLGATPLDGELVRCRAALAAGGDGIAAARAEAGLVAVRAASALAATTGARSLLRDGHVQRLWREALFALVYALRPQVREALLERLGSEALVGVVDAGPADGAGPADVLHGGASERGDGP